MKPFNAKSNTQSAPQAAPSVALAAGSSIDLEMARRANGSRAGFLLGALLFLVVVGVFLPAVTHDFITYDDPVYVTQNVHVTSGLSWANVRWAFKSTEASNWHPLTWLSHMADCQLYGLHPWGHHLTNVLLHALSAVLLFIVLRNMTGAAWRSLFVAALFGLHPLHVESVAWIAERKDVLSTFFWMLVLWAYARRTELAAGRRPWAWSFYGLALLFFACGLMCKPMLVTLPCVLLLLDYWPLNRWKDSSSSARRLLLIEKIPFFALSICASAITLFAQRNGGTVGSTEDFSFSLRVANALLAYCRYLGKCFVPIKLAVFYPYFAEQPPRWESLLTGGLLLGITVAAGLLMKRRPYLLVGWLWFLGTMIPVIGLVQVGGQSMADRYTYLPLIGVFIMLVWATSDTAILWPYRSQILGVFGGAVLVALTAITCRQLSFWKDGAVLFRHAIAVTDNNWVAHANLSATLAKSARPEARAEFQETLRILAAFAETHDRRGIELARTPGHSAEAIEEFQTAVRIMRDLPLPHYNLGVAFSNLPGRQLEAIEEFKIAVRLNPSFVDAHYRLAFLLSETPGREDDSIVEYKAVVALDPNHYQARYNLGVLLAGLPGRTNEAIETFEAVLAVKPDLTQAQEMIKRLQSSSQ